MRHEGRAPVMGSACCGDSESFLARELWGLILGKPSKKENKVKIPPPEGSGDTPTTGAAEPAALSEAERRSRDKDAF